MSLLVHGHHYGLLLLSFHSIVTRVTMKVFVVAVKIHALLTECLDEINRQAQSPSTEVETLRSLLGGFDKVHLARFERVCSQDQPQCLVRRLPQSPIFTFRTSLSLWMMRSKMLSSSIIMNYECATQRLPSNREQRWWRGCSTEGHWLTSGVAY